MSDLEKKLYDLLHELPQKRNDYEELQQRYSSELLQKRELQTDVERLQMEVQTLRTQLSLVNKALHKCEENLSSSRDSAVKHSLNLEAATKTIDGIKERSTKLHLENGKLKKKIEELERDIKAEAFFRDPCTTKQTKTKATVDTLVTQMRNLDKDYKEMERHAKEAILKCKKSKLMMEHKDATIAHLNTKVEELTMQVIHLNSSNKTLEENMKSQKPVEQNYVKEILQEWQSSIHEIESRTASYEKESETLQKTLKNALDAQSRFQNLEAAASERVRKLEAQLCDERKAKKKSKFDCAVQTEFNMTMDVACGTTQLERTNVATQTETSTPQNGTRDEVMVTSEGNNSTNKQRDYKNNLSPAQLATTAAATTAISSSATLGELMSKYQQSKDMSFLEDLSELPTQINPNLSEKQ